MTYQQSLAAVFCAAALVACDHASTESIIGPTTAPLLSQATLTLTGESFTGPATITGNCDEGTGTGFFSFSASGPAAGPYPGTFEESGDFGIFGGPASFFSQFTINSTSQISGQKFDASQLGGFCGEGFVFVSGVVRYQANIDGVFDEGIAQVDLVGDAAGQGESFFNEFFITSFAQPVVILEPFTALNPVGSTHTVTATVFGSLSGQPQPGVTVRFFVSSPSGFTATGTCTTSSDGQCTFTYQGPQEPDVHTIEGCPDNQVGQCGYATKIFFVPASTPGQVTGGGQIIHESTIRAVSFGFNAQLNDGKFHGSGVVIDHRTKTQIKILDVDFLFIAGTHATFRGRAEVNG